MLKPFTLSNIKSLCSNLLIGIFFLVLIVSCTPDLNEKSPVDVVELDMYETIVSFEDNLLATPTSLIFDIDHNNRRIFVVTEKAEIRAYDF